VMTGVTRGWTWNATRGMILTVILRAFCIATLGGKRGQSRGDTSTKRREERVADVSPARGRAVQSPFSRAIRSVTLSATCRGTLAVNFTVTCEATFTTPLRGGVRREEGGGRSQLVSSYPG